MLRTLSISLLLLATIVPMTASAAPDPCDKYGICYGASIEDGRACAGVGSQFDAWVVCGDTQSMCVSTRIGLAYHEVCFTPL